MFLLFFLTNLMQIYNHILYIVKYFAIFFLIIFHLSYNSLTINKLKKIKNKEKRHRTSHFRTLPTKSQRPKPKQVWSVASGAVRCNRKTLFIGLIHRFQFQDFQCIQLNCGGNLKYCHLDHLTPQSLFWRIVQKLLF